MGLAAASPRGSISGLDGQTVRWCPGQTGVVQPAVTFVLGKPPERTPVVAAVIGALAAGGALIQTVVPSRGQELPLDIAGQRLIVQRGLSRPHLAALEPWAERCCNDPRSVAITGDRQATVNQLAAGGLTVPPAEVVTDYTHVPRSSGKYVIKSLDATIGRGASVLLPNEPVPDQAPFPGPYLVQRFIHGWEAKLYVFGDQVRGLARPSSRRSGGRVFSPGGELVELARGVGITLGLELFGVDVIVTSDRAYVVDVNPFPAASKVAGSAELITAYLRTRVASAPPEPSAP